MCRVYSVLRVSLYGETRYILIVPVGLSDCYFVRVAHYGSTPRGGAGAGDVREGRTLGVRKRG